MSRTMCVCGWVVVGGWVGARACMHACVWEEENSVDIFITHCSTASSLGSCHLIILNVLQCTALLPLYCKQEKVEQERAAKRARVEAEPQL